jgi:thiol-disulfide isomerase/thioredoxin
VYKGEVGPVEVQGTSLPALGSSDVASDPARGMAAPIVIGQDFDGNTVRIDAASDGPTLAVFLAHWCPHCNREVPRINQLRDQGAFPEGLNIIGISTGISPDRPNWPPSQWFKDMDWTYPVIADGIDVDQQKFIAADAYGLDSFPFMVLIGKDGKVLARWSGEREPDALLKLITDNLPTGA